MEIGWGQLKTQSFVSDKKKKKPLNWTLEWSVYVWVYLRKHPSKGRLALANCETPFFLLQYWVPTMLDWFIEFRLDGCAWVVCQNLDERNENEYGNCIGSILLGPSVRHHPIGTQVQVFMHDEGKKGFSKDTKFVVIAERRISSDKRRNEGPALLEKLRRELFFLFFRILQKSFFLCHNRSSDQETRKKQRRCSWDGLKTRQEDKKTRGITYMQSLI